MSTSATTSSSAQPRVRLRELVPNVPLGKYPPGPLNSLTDVPGVLVSTTTIKKPQTETAGAINTGITTILPRRNWFHSACHAGFFRFNGSGEMTGIHWIEETGLLHSPIVLTNSFAVGPCYTGVYQYGIKHHVDAHGRADWFLLPCVGETYDGYLNDVTQFPLTPAHTVAGSEAASAAPVPEGSVGGGTGMICHFFKGGTGSASRRVPAKTAAGGAATFSVGALVQANYGRPDALRIAGVPVGRILAERKQQATAELERAKDRKDGSIIVVLATDAPLHPLQCQRLAKRATVGLARVGGVGHNPSGDLFLAFSTANEVPVQTVGMEHRDVDPWTPEAMDIQSVDEATINALFEAAADATEEAIYNVLCMAEKVDGLDGHEIEPIDLEAVKEIMGKYL